MLLIIFQKNLINSQCGKGAMSGGKETAYKIVWTEGCVDALIAFVRSNLYPIAGILIGIAVVQVKTAADCSEDTVCMLIYKCA